MHKVITFANNGHLDMTLIKTFGVSEKEKESPIGYFGTGLKYAIAILVRNNCNITIKTGGKIYKIGKKKKKIRNGYHEIITCNGRTLPFSTELGKNWEVWQAFRELYSNTIDEQGIIVNGTPAKKYDTEIIVDGNAITEAWKEKDSIFLNSKPVCRSDVGTVEVYNGQSDYIFYKGIRCCQLSKPSLYTYNILDNMILTEDRTFADPTHARYKIESFLATSENVTTDLINNVIVSHNDYYESSFNFSYDELSDKFKKCAHEYIKNFDERLNKTIIYKLKKYLDEQYINASTSHFNDDDVVILEKAKEICKKIIDIDEYKIRCAEYLGDGVMGAAKDNVIYLTRLALSSGETIVASTLLEEYIHLKYKLHDETRMLESFLFNMIINLANKLED